VRALTEELLVVEAAPEGILPLDDGVVVADDGRRRRRLAVGVVLLAVSFAGGGILWAAN